MQRVATKFTDLPNDMIVANFGHYLSPRDMFRLATATKTLRDLHFSNTERFWRSLTPFKLLAMPQLAAEDIVAVVKHYPELSKKFIELSTNFSSQIIDFYLTFELGQLLKLARACHILHSNELLPIDIEALISTNQTTQPRSDLDYRKVICHALLTTDTRTIDNNNLKIAIEWLSDDKNDVNELRHSLTKTYEAIWLLGARQMTLDWQPKSCYTNLSKATLWQFNLSHAHLQGANLREADMTWAYLDFAYLQGATLQKTNLYRAYMPMAELQHADLREATLECAELAKANLQKANLQKAKLKNANLAGANLREANLQQANLQQAYLYNANLEKADLRRTNLEGATLLGANLQGTMLQAANLETANLQGAALQGANLQNTNVQYAKLQNANLQGANLQNASLSVTDLQRANLKGAMLQEANLESANLQRAALQGANLQGTNLEGADLNGASFFDQNDLSSTKSINSAMNKFYAACRDNQAFAMLRSSMLADLIKQITHSPAAGAQQQLTTPDQDLKINLLEAAYQHPLFNEHRHLTIIRDAINAIYRAMASLSCCGLFGARFKRDLIETRSQSVLNETLNTVSRRTQTPSV